MDQDIASYEVIRLRKIELLYNLEKELKKTDLDDETRKKYQSYYDLFKLFN